MKKLIFLILATQTVNLLSAQTHAEIIGKTVTDSIQVIDGAVTGHLLQSSNGMGLGKWVSPTTVMDNLGDHTATMSLNMTSHKIEKVDTILLPMVNL